MGSKKKHKILNYSKLTNRYTPVVYVLRDPVNGDIRYVGKTTMARQRYSGHLCVNENKASLPKRDLWVLELKASGRKPIMEIIHICGSKRAMNAYEIFWFVRYLEEGADLLNSDRYDAEIIQAAHQSVNEHDTLKAQMADFAAKVGLDTVI